MKTLLHLTTILGLTLMATMLPVAAAVEVDNDPPGAIGVWLFLAFCSLIIVAQLLPHFSKKLRQERRTEEGTVKQPEQVTER